MSSQRADGGGRLLCSSKPSAGHPVLRKKTTQVIFVKCYVLLAEKVCILFLYQREATWRGIGRKGGLFRTRGR
ncbi:hypothetical protein FXO38_24192, partial [Capsicum annuum]